MTVELTIDDLRDLLGAVYTVRLRTFDDGHALAVEGPGIPWPWSWEYDWQRPGSLADQTLAVLRARFGIAADGGASW